MENFKELDSGNPSVREEFSIPTLRSLGYSSGDNDAIYLCGNSLGLMPKRTRDAVDHELNVWSRKGVNGHFDHDKEPWVSIDDPATPLMAKLVGAKPEEVAIMGTLTGNLNSLLVAFYKIQGKRRKILYERKAFPSDRYAFENIVRLAMKWQGLEINGDENVDDYLLKMEPREGEYTIRTEDILKVIKEQGDEIALVCFSGVQFYTGQLFDMETITRVGKEQGCVVGWDLAHAAGNVVTKLHDWNVDFACWCSYKYLNSGPGGIAGLFVHENWSARDYKEFPRLAGWWGNKLKNRFDMEEQFDVIPGAGGFRTSNPSVLNVVCLTESLKLIDEFGGIEKIRSRSKLLTQYLWDLLTVSPYFVRSEKDTSNYKFTFTILTPEDPEQRGAQLSLLFLPSSDDKIMEKVHSYISERGVVGDERKPNVIRLAPSALYNTFEDVSRAVEILNNALKDINGA